MANERTKMNDLKNLKAETAYIEAYTRAMAALKAIEEMIHDKPAPEGDVKIHWGHVGDMARIASQLEDIL